LGELCQEAESKAPASWRSPYAPRLCNRQPLAGGLWRAAALTPLWPGHVCSQAGFGVGRVGPVPRRLFGDKLGRPSLPRAALRLPWADVPPPHWGGAARGAPAAGRSASAAGRNHFPELGACSSQLRTPGSMPHAPCCFYLCVRNELRQIGGWTGFGLAAPVRRVHRVGVHQIASVA